VRVTDAGNPARTATRALSITISSGGGSTPGAPVLSAGLGKFSGVLLSWTAAAPNGSAVTNYKVYRRVQGGVQALLATLGNVLSYKDRATTRDVTYCYQVSAVNANGEGTKSLEMCQAAK